MNQSRVFDVATFVQQPLPLHIWTHSRSVILMESQRRQQWFDTSVIVRKILKHFPHMEILSFSLVNATWNSEAKSLLTERGNTVAVIAGTRSPIDKSGRYRSASPPLFFRTANYALKKTMPLAFRKESAHACEDFVAFAKMLEVMTTPVAPFTQLDIHIDINHPGSCSSIEDSTIANLIETKCTFRSVRLAVYQAHCYSRMEWEERKGKHECSALRFFTRIFQRLAPHLVQLGFIVETELKSNLPFGSHPIPREFPKLMVLTFVYLDINRESIHPVMLLLKEIVQSSPDLERLEMKHVQSWGGLEAAGAFVGDFMSTVMEGSRALLVWQGVPKNLEQLSETILNRLAISCMCRSMAHLDKKEILLLRNSQHVLESISFSKISLLRLFMAGTRFTGLQHLTLSYPSSPLQQQLILLQRVLQTMFDKRAWKALFPNLRDLKLDNYGSVSASLFEATRELETHRAVTESSSFRSNDQDPGLELESLSMTFRPDESISDPEMVQGLAPITHVKTLRLQAAFCSLVFGRDLAGVEDLELDVFGCVQNMDCLFCGIYPEEAERLRRKGLKYLKAVHIVPPKPAITAHRELKKLIFLDPCAGRIPLVISDLTVAICLRRMPGLTVVHKIIVDEPVKPILLPIEFPNLMKRFPELKIRTEVYGGHYWLFPAI